MGGERLLFRRPAESYPDSDGTVRSAGDPEGFRRLRQKHVDEFLFLPVSAGMWKQHELWDGTYTLDDLLDIVELIRVQRENENRAEDTARQG